MLESVYISTFIFSRVHRTSSDGTFLIITHMCLEMERKKKCVLNDRPLVYIPDDDREKLLVSIVVLSFCRRRRKREFVLSNIVWVCESDVISSKI